MERIITLTLSLLLSSLAYSALYDRGNGLIYDDVLDITWLQDANFALSSGAGDWDGGMYYLAAKSWVESLNYEGYANWRLPKAYSEESGVINCFEQYDGVTCDRGYNITGSELGYMFYVNLGNKGQYSTQGNENNTYGLENTSFVDASTGQVKYFQNINNNNYWFEDIYVNGSTALAFTMHFGVQVGRDADYYEDHIWVVADGDIANTAPVPVPAAAWLFGSALLGWVWRLKG